jgi:hypothetical protein
MNSCKGVFFGDLRDIDRLSRIINVDSIKIL